MSYEMVNEELNIKAYSLKDPDMKVSQVLRLRDSFTYTPSLEDMGKCPYFFEKDGTLAVNRDNEYYTDFLEIAEGLLKLDPEQIGQFVLDAPQSIRPYVVTIRRCIEAREARKMCDQLDKDKYFFPEAQEMSVLHEIWKRKQGYNADWLMVYAFHYGFIQGKRYERARKAKRTKSEARENSPRVANVEWFETQFLPLIKEFVKETYTLDDHEFTEVALQLVDGCKESSCAKFMAASVVKTISQAREELKGRTTSETREPEEVAVND